MIIRRTRAVIILLGIFLWDLVAASLAVARIVLSPSVQTRPAIICVPVSLRRPWAVALFAYFTSLTPGSTCLHVAEDGSTLYVHVLDTPDHRETTARFKQL